jgi:hypothetical protein
MQLEAGSGATHRQIFLLPLGSVKCDTSYLPAIPRATPSIVGTEESIAINQ